MTLSPAQCRAARALLNWSQEDLVRASGITKKTIADLERGATTPRGQTLDQIVAAFEAAGIDVNSLDTWDKRRDAALKVSNPDKKMWGWGLTVNKSGDAHGFILAVIQGAEMESGNYGALIVVAVSMLSAVAMMGLNRLKEYDPRAIVVHFSGTALVFSAACFLASTRSKP